MAALKHFTITKPDGSTEMVQADNLAVALAYATSYFGITSTVVESPAP